MALPTISVVLPCLDAAETLGEAVESIRAQTFTDWELVLVDDGSTDTSPEIARRFAAMDRRIRPAAGSHAGIAGVLERGCALARGSYIARMDADDIAHSERLQRQLDCMTADPRIGICGTQVRMTGGTIGPGRRRYETWINALISHDDIVRELFVECPLAHPTFMIRRDVFNAAGGYEDHGWAEDHDLCMRLFLAGARFAKVAEPLLDWRESPGRLSMVSERYNPVAFRALKRHYLFRSYLKDRDIFHQWGAGEVGKPWLREWEEQRPMAVVDINPRKIGRVIHNTPVIAPGDLPAPGDTFTVIAVGAPTARQEIRAWFEPRGYHELRDYLFLA
ncbi:MAG: glycosyltransferase [Nitrospiraceae bacterium]|nr:glycosyltransferase [Nitrospiraceae bacterium]